MKPKEQIKPIADKPSDEFLTKKETYNRLLNEKLNEIWEINDEIDYDNLVYYFKTRGGVKINVIKFKGPFSLF